ncbi:hypothetical protein V1282_005676 [Nitrobacteraceae bacterium AZCC 2146]
MKQPASETPSEIVSVLYQAAIPKLIVLIEHNRSVIKLIQLNEPAQGDVRGNSIVLDDVAPWQTLRNTLPDEFDLRLREALQFLLEAMKYEIWVADSSCSGKRRSLSVETGDI